MNIFREYEKGILFILMIAIAIVIVINVNSLFAATSAVYHAFLPLIIGLCMAFVLDIIVNRYEKILYFPKPNKFVDTIRRPVAILLSIISVFLMVGIVMYLAIPQTVHSITLTIQHLPELYDKLMKHVLNLTSVLSMADQHVVNDLLTGKKILANISEYATSWLANIAATVSDIVMLLVNFIIGFVFSIYLLLNKKELQRELGLFVKAYVSEKAHKKVLHISEIINSVFSSFFIGQFLDALTLGLMVGITMAISGLPYALNIGCVVGLTALIPLLGAYIGASIGVMMLLVESPWDALWFIVILIVMQQIENNLIYPKIVGDSVGLPGIWVFAAIVVGANIYGVIGILLSVPIAATAYRLLRDDVHNRLAARNDVDEV